MVILNYALIINNSWNASPDSALYLSLGKSISQGNGYIFNGVLHTFVPPGFPFLIAASSWIGGDGFLTYRIMMAVMGILAAGAGYLLIRKIVGPEVAFVIGGVFALNHELLHDSTMILADSPFALVFLVAMNALLWTADNRASGLKVLLTAAVFGLLPLIRINGIGIPLFASFFLFCSWKDDSRPMRWLWTVVFSTISFASFVLWQIWKAYFSDSPFEGSYSAAVTGNSLFKNMTFVVLGFLSSFKEITFSFAGVSLRTGILELFLPVAVYVGMAAAFARGDRLLVPLAVLQLPLIALAGFGSRYVLFLTPLFYLFAALGLLQISRFLSNRVRIAWDHGKVVLACFALMAVLNIGHNALTVFQARNALEYGGAESERSLPFFHASRWLKANAPGSGILTTRSRIMHYLTGSPAVPLFRSGAPHRMRWVDDPKDIEALLTGKRPEFIFADSKHAELYEKVKRTIKDLGYDVRLVPEAVSSSRFSLYRICGNCQKE